MKPIVNLVSLLGLSKKFCPHCGKKVTTTETYCDEATRLIAKTRKPKRNKPKVAHPVHHKDV